jgi:hypothetical protein
MMGGDCCSDCLLLIVERCSSNAKVRVMYNGIEGLFHLLLVFKLMLLFELLGLGLQLRHIVVVFLQMHVILQ